MAAVESIAKAQVQDAEPCITDASTTSTQAEKNGISKGGRRRRRRAPNRASRMAQMVIRYLDAEMAELQREIAEDQQELLGAQHQCRWAQYAPGGR